MSKFLACPNCGETEIYRTSEDNCMCGSCHHKNILLDFIRPQHAISTSDGHDEDWTYYKSEVEALETFEYMKSYESDIHLYKLNENGEYEVIDSWWDGDE